MTRLLWLGALAVALLVAPAPLAQTDVIISQESSAGAGDFNANVLGTVKVFTTTGTVATFYDYHDNKFNGPTPTHPANQAALYFVKGSDGIALFAVYDRTSTGGQSQAVFRYDVDNAAFVTPLAVTDDDNDPQDSYVYTNANATLTHTARWPNGATDGFAAFFTGTTPTITAAPVSFNSRVTGWNALSQDGNTIALAFSVGRRVKLSLAGGNHQMPTDDLAGWRLLSTPVGSLSLMDLAGINLVQGIPAGITNGPEYDAHQANIFYQYDGTIIVPDQHGQDSTVYVYQPIPDTDYVFAPGQGFWWYWFDMDLDPSAPGVGTSVSRDLADTDAALVYNGAPITADVAVTLQNNPHGFFMGGNPFALPFAVDGISSDVGVVQSIVSSWSPALQSHVQYFFSNPGTGEPDFAAVWQGLLAEVTDGGSPLTTDPTLTYAYSSTDVSESPVFNGKSGARGPVPHMHLLLDGNTASGGATADHSSWIRFLPDADMDWDRHDGSKLFPFGDTYALIAPTQRMPDADNRRLAVMSMPDGTTGPLPRKLDAPIAFMATEGGTYLLSWEDTVLPEGWRAFLTDRLTGNRVKMWKTSSYLFEADAGDWSERFLIRFRPAAAVEAALASGASLETDEPSLGTPYPNPSADEARAVLDLDAQQHVELHIVDMLGREVVTVREGQMEPGMHTLILPVERLAAGSYVLRVRSRTLNTSHSLMVVR